MRVKNQKILAISAHPDDVEYWAGGTILKLAKDNQIYILVATDGGLNGSARVRQNEQRQTAALIGAKKIIFLNYPDAELSFQGIDLQRDLLRAVLEIRPQVVFSYDPENQHRVAEDTHPDHRHLALAVTDLILIYSTLPSYAEKLKLSLRPLMKKPDLWLFHPYQPDHLEDITGQWQRKKELIRAFKTQKLDWKKAEIQARRQGVTLGVKYAEGFKRVAF